MEAIRIVAVLLTVGGAIGLIPADNIDAKTTHEARVGPIEGKATVRVPLWAGAGAIGLGTALLVTRRKR